MMLRDKNIMESKKIYITINHLEHFQSGCMFKPGDILLMKKDHENCYDDEAIVARNKHQVKCGYVANSVCSVYRGTYSAGRIYDKVPEEFQCVVRFANEDALIGEVEVSD